MFDSGPIRHRLKFEHLERSNRKKQQECKCWQPEEVVYEDMGEQRAYLAAAIGNLDVTIE